MMKRSSLGHKNEACPLPGAPARLRVSVEGGRAALACYESLMDLLESPVSMLMSTDDLIVGAPEDSLMQIWDLMAEESIEHVPILRGDTLVGLLSSWDLAEFAVTRGPEAMKQVTAGELMEQDLVALRPRASLKDAANMLADGGFHALPVTDGDNALVGILTSSDVIGYVATGRLRDD